MELQEVYKEAEKDFLDAGIYPGPILRVEWSTRMTMAMGKTIKRGPIFIIRINEALKNDPKALRDVLAHELAHTVEGCMNHGPNFKAVAEKMTKYGYEIETYFDESKYENLQPKKPKYLIECEGCGRKVGRYRKSKFTENLWRYRCGECGAPFRRIY